MKNLEISDLDSRSMTEITQLTFQLIQNKLILNKAEATSVKWFCSFPHLQGSLIKEWFNLKFLNKLSLWKCSTGNTLERGWIPFTACLVWYLVPWEDWGCCCWPCCCWLCCLCNFCMCHFWEEVWNLFEEFHTTRWTAGAVSFGRRGLCFFTGLPVAAAGVLTAEVVLVVAVTPAGGVWDAERVSTWVSVGGWLLVLEEGGVLAATNEQENTMLIFTYSAWLWGGGGERKHSVPI